MPEIIPLPGCTAEPLSNYLKALGVLRLVVEQKKDPAAKGCWRNNSFALITNLSKDELVKFFLQDYQPTPLVSPWNGSTGFYPKDNKKTIEAILNSQTKRLVDYRETVHSAQKQVDDLKLTAQPKDKDEKRKLLTKLRNNLPDQAVKWLDTCTLINSEELKFPPLTGTGGNDGNFEFSRTFIQQLQELFDFQSGEPKENTKLLLQASLFDATVPGLTFAGKIGQFNPIAAGGANAAPGYDADSRVNPWDYVLMLEGIMLFTSGATRRYEQSESADFAYPFTVRPSNIGYGSAADGDEARAELWTPLWSAPTGLKELELLFNEGRAKVGGRTARNGVDFARAISSQGEQRGIDEFTRYSFQVRNGLSYFAIPLGRFQPIVNPQVDRLVELDGWLSHFKRAVNDANAPASAKRAHRRLETAFFEFSLGKKPLLDVLIALGEVEAALDRSLRFTKDKFLQPIPALNSQWIQDCNDSSTEFRLALALAGRELRPRLVQVRKNKYGRNEWLENDDGITTWQVGTLENNLIALLRRTTIESEQHSKQQGENLNTESETEWTFPQAQLDDIVRWIQGDIDDARIEEIARGLSLVKLSKERPQSSIPTLPIPTAYALVAIVHHRTLKRYALQRVFHDNTLAQDLTLPAVPALLGKLAVGDCYTATGLAARRLYASGLNPAITEGVFEPTECTRRIAAALAFPISDVNIARLLKQIKRFDPKTDSKE